MDDMFDKEKNQNVDNEKNEKNHNMQENKSNTQEDQSNLQQHEHSKIDAHQQDENEKSHLDPLEDKKSESTLQSEQDEMTSSYYYASGSFRETTSQFHGELHKNDEQHASSSGESEKVMEPNSDNTISIYPTSPKTDTDVNKVTGHYTYQKKPRSSFKSMFASFMVGVLVVGTLMFSADYFNWFTNSTNQSINYSNSTTGNSSSPISTAAFNPFADENTIANIVDQTSQSVVKIETYAQQSNSNLRSRDDIFNYFFGNNDGQSDNNSSDYVQTGLGSGFIFDAEGYILTNQHVIDGAENIVVKIDGYAEPFEAELLGSDFDLDLAVLKIQGDEPFPMLTFGDSDALRVGEWVTAIGNPVGFDHTVSVGVISAKEREINIGSLDGAPRNYEHLLQTDASINPGNSGGPLLNLNGEVIGVNTAVSTEAQGIGFAISSNIILDVIEPLKNNETIARPYIGVYLSDVEEKDLSTLGLESTEGTYITQIMQNTPASKAGLQAGDFVIEVNGNKIENTEQFVDTIGDLQIGAKTNLVVLRDGNEYDVIVIIGDKSEYQ
ncbi:S1C family serine protease [Longirhabdus pacifica]|uniref:S1C family serine protease n=1 Tax=Longirhabdus pacifica TaxID=2305227 RepID=UPI0013E8C760|nr:trypsin-like peptidase domain-containing protein [Longirhabdus pacifica]